MKKSHSSSRSHRRARRAAARRAGSRWLMLGALAASATVASRSTATLEARTLDSLLAIGADGRRTTAKRALPPEFRIADAAFPAAAWLTALDPAGVAYPRAWVAQAQTAPTDPPPVRRFDIAPGPLSAVLAAFARETGVTVTPANESIGALASPGVSGLYSVEDALKQMLSGTGVAYSFRSVTEVTLEIERINESVEVTATQPRPASARYARTLTETPQTIQVIPRQVMEAQGVTTLTEALRNVPGISLQAGEGGGASSTSGDMFNMRGFSANNSLFVDGVRDDGLVSRDVFNLEQVEVFLGPTGSDVGRGTASGYVNMTTKSPRAQSLYAGSIGIGTSEQKRGAVDINQPLALGEAGSWLEGTAFRLNALVQDSDVPGRDFVNLETRAVAPSLAFGLGTHTRLAVGGQFLEQDNLPDYGIPGAAWPDGPIVPNGNVAAQSVDQSNYYGSPDVDYDRVSQDSYFARFEHDLNGQIQLKNQTRHNRTHRSAVISAVQSPASYVPATGLVTIARQGNERDNRVTSNQTSIAANAQTGRVRHALTGTVEFTSEKQFAPTLIGLGTRLPTDINNPDPFAPVTGFAPARNGAFNEGDTSTFAVSFFDAIDLSSRLQLTGGARVERYSTDFLVVDAAGARTTDETAEDTLFSGKIGLLYKLTNQGNVYVSYGSTKTPPGTANFTLSSQPNNANNPNVDPQESTNLEVGSKWDFYGGRLSLNGAVFHTKNKNVIFTVDATAVPPIFNQDDAQQVDGVSFGVSGRIVRSWDVVANFAYLDSENLSQNPANAGRRLTLTPEFSGSVWTTYTTPIGLMVGGGVRLMDSVYVNAGNTIQVPSYQIVDAMATYAVNRQISLRLNVYNLTDEVYIRNINNNGGRYNPGNPRTAVLTASFSF
jgi:catecholate siderophore receptor